jgi:PPOX class probable F420-dependent enzyme
MTSVAATDSRPDPELRTRRFLADEPVIWLSTVREDGLPHLVPVWFWWDGETVLVFSKPHAVKVRALRANPRAMIALGEPDDDFDVAMVEARAELLDETPAVPEAFFAKYGDKLAAGMLDRETFRATYTQAIRFTPTRWLAWHGRSPRPVTPVSPVAASITATHHARPMFRRALDRLTAMFEKPQLATA